MNARPVRHILVLFTVAVLLFGSCGGDDEAATTTSDDSTTSTEPGSGDAAETSEPETSEPAGSDSSRSDYEAALTDALAEPVSDDDIDLEGESAACAAAALLDVVGVERLVAAGVAPDQFAGADSFAELDLEVDEAEVDRLGEALDACVDFRRLLVDTAPEGYACLADTIDESAMARSVATEWVTGETFDLTMVMFESAEPACAEQVFLATGVAQGDITQAQADCVAAILDDQVAVRILEDASTPAGPAEEDAAALEDAFFECDVHR